LLEDSSTPVPSESIKAGFQGFTTPEACRRLTAPWVPRCGVPALIREQSKAFPCSREVERIESFIYFSGVAHIVRRGSSMRGDVFRRVKRMKVEAGQWEKIRPSIKIFNPFTGEHSGIGEAWTLTPAYWREVALADLLSPRYGFASSSRLYPRKPRRPGGIAPTVAEYLREGTGILPKHSLVIEKLYGSTDYDAFMEALRAWRILSITRPGIELRPRWVKSPKCGRIFARRPALQQIPSRLRPGVLAGKDRPLYEVDYTGCHMNLIRSIAGLPPQDDPWKELTRELKDSGYRISRPLTKALVTPVLYGQGKGKFCEVNSAVVENPGELYGRIRRELPQNPQPLKIMQMESRILLDVLARMNEAGIPPGLSIHDSILTEYPEIVKPLMLEISEEITGFPQPVELTG